MIFFFRPAILVQVQGGSAMTFTYVLHEDYEDFASRYLGIDYEDFVNLEKGVDETDFEEIEYEIPSMI